MGAVSTSCASGCEKDCKDGNIQPHTPRVAEEEAGKVNQVVDHNVLNLEDKAAAEKGTVAKASAQKVAKVTNANGVASEGPEARKISKEKGSRPPASEKAFHARPDVYHIIIDKTNGGDIGVNVAMHTDETLPILEIKAGLFSDWNAANPQKAVEPGDHIIEVNGVLNDAVQLAKKFASDKLLNIVLKRASCFQNAGKANHFKFLIVGGGVAAGYACREFVAGGVGAGEIGIVQTDPWQPYERPALSKAYLHPPGSAIRARLPGFHTCVGTGGERQTSEWYEEKGIKFVPGPATALDPEQKILHCGDKPYTYDKVFIATGSAPVVPGLPGASLRGIHYIREEKDAAALVQHLEALNKGDKVVIVGGGYICMETAAAIIGWGFDVTVVVRQEHVMSKLFNDDHLAKWLEDEYEKRGIKFRRRTVAKSFVKKGDEVCGVRIQAVPSKAAKAGPMTTLNCSLVIVGVGAKANLNFINAESRSSDKETGHQAQKVGAGAIAMNKGGIQVNENMETNLKDVYAMGDVITFPSFYGDFRRHEHVDNARKSAIQAARAAIGKSPPNYNYLPYCYSRVFEYTDNPIIYYFYGDRFGNPTVINRGADGIGSVWEKDKRIIGIMLMSTPGPSLQEKERMAKIAMEQPPMPEKDKVKELGKLFDNLMDKKKPSK